MQHSVVLAHQHGADLETALAGIRHGRDRVAFSVRLGARERVEEADALAIRGWWAARPSAAATSTASWRTTCSAIVDGRIAVLDACREHEIWVDDRCRHDRACAHPFWGRAAAVVRRMSSGRTTADAAFPITNRTGEALP